MLKKREKLIIKLLFLLLVIGTSLMSTTRAFAVAQTTDSAVSVNPGDFGFDEGTGTIIGYNNNSQVVIPIIPYKINGVAVTRIGDSAFKGCSNLTSVTIPNSVTSMGDYTFYDCNKLTSITIPNSVTSIGNSVFGKCINLGSVTLPNSITSIGDFAFRSSGLTSIIIPDKVTSIGDSAFYDCNSLKSITVPDSVTSIKDYAFKYCEKAIFYVNSEETKELLVSCGVDETKIVFNGQPTGVTLNTTTLSLKKGNTSTLIATVLPTSVTNKGVTWISSNTNVATVDSNGKITAIAEGNAVITCTTTYGIKKSATCNVTVPKESVTGINLKNTSLNVEKGGTATLTATVSPTSATNKTVIWSSSNTKVATVDSNGKITGVGYGTTVITCTTNDGSKTATCNVTVITSVASVKLNNTSLNVEKGKTATLIETVNPTSATNKTVIWSSSNTNVATVDNKGKITGVEYGTSVITCTTNDGNKTATCSITVGTSVTSINLDNTSFSLEKGNTATITATVNPTNATVTWSSSDTKVATVDTTGKVTAVSAGNATITCTANDGSKKSATSKVTVPSHPTSIKLNNTSLSLEKGKTSALIATVSPTNVTNKTLTWSSSDTNIATVDTTGKVTAVAAGTAIITCKTNDLGIIVTCNVAVSIVPVTSVKLSNASLSLEKGKTSTLTATVSPTNATNATVTWSSSDTSVATVDNKGKITSVGYGTAVITCKTNDQGKTATCNVTVTTSVTGVTLNKASLNLETGETSTLISTVNPTNAINKTLTWSSNNTKVATVDNNGKITAVAGGNATITCIANDGSKKSATCNVTVTTSVTSITLNNTSLGVLVGKTSTLVATVSPTSATNKALIWRTENEKIATVDPNGKVTGVGAGKTTTIYCMTKEGNFKIAQCTVNVS